MALSFEESKRLMSQQAATPMMMSMPADIGVMTLAENDATPIEAYEQWTIIDGYAWFDNYYDDKISYIDKNKVITIDASQVNISQEINSQFIPFEMQRYYDGIDLINMAISIHYDRSDGTHGSSTPVNVQYCTDKIKFVWLVDGQATCVAGNLKFEIHADGAIVDSVGRTYGYRWKSKSTDKFNILKSLCADDCEGKIFVSDDWVQDIVEDVTERVTNKIVDAEISVQVSAAEEYAAQAATSASEAASAAQNAVTNVLGEYATKTYVDDTVADIDVTEQLVNYALKSEVPTKVSELENDANYLTEHQDLSDYALKTDIPTNYLTEIPEEYITDEELNNKGYLTEHQSLEAYALKSDVPSIDGLATETYVQEEIEKIDVTEQLGDYALKTYVDEQIASVDVSGQLVDYAKSADVYTKTEVDNKTDTLSSSIGTNTSSITSLNKTVEEINKTLAGIDNAPRVTYEATYGNVEMDDGTTQEYMFTLWETEGENSPTVKSRFQIMGGGGGSTSSVTLRVAYIDGYTTPIVATANDSVIVKYEFSGEDSAGDTNLDGVASWKVGNRVVATQDVATGTCEFDLTEYVNIGDNKIVLTITHATGAIATKAWTIKVVDVRLESNFDDTKVNKAGQPVNFTFTPFGGVEKTVHFLLDGKEIDTKTSSAAASGLSDSYSIAAKEHGTHLFEVYMTAAINNKTVESNHIIKDVIWYDESSSNPVISCVNQSFTARQYEATNIKYTIYDPTTETPSVTLKSTYVNSDGETVEEFISNLVLDANTQVWQYKTDVIGKHTLTITCGDVVKTLIANIVELGIEVAPITSGLVFDFNPVGRSNNDENRLWSNGDIGMTVSDNFDWVNGGYQIDNNGDQCFCIKAGTSAEINYELFGNDAKVNGKQFKLIFKTENVAEPDTTFLSCVSDTTGSDHVGIEMKAHEATIYAKTASLPLPYAEEEIIEFEFNITPDSETPSMIMGYEDGVSTRPLVYDATHDFQQHKDYRKVISLGSNDCDLYIYRFKVYNNSLSDRDILNNFIADARSAEEMIARYERNQIYKEGILDPDYLAEVCPQLRIIKIETPYFTSDKDEKIGRIAVESTGEVLQTTVECIYKGGDPILDNWVATDVVHSGQGTSSNNYGPAGRNLDVIMKRYKDKKTDKYLNESPIVTFSDGTQASKISLTRKSVDINYLNIKVNIASSENANNALLAKRFNTYQPYTRPVVRSTEEEAAKVKDTMEFQNCVIFVKETHPTISTHREFADNNWHFYGIGNIGDSKKTDDTRLTDPSDPYECILEVMDNTLPNSTMPTGKVDEDGNPVYPIAKSEWAAGNSAYDSLYADTFDEAKADTATGKLADTYGWRYIYEDGTDEQNAEYRAYVENAWREFYEFVVTATDEEFKAHLGDYCVLNSVMYYYLFTLRYTMTDNHAKNSFWHYGKTGEVDEEGNPIRKWDLNFDYDNDTALGIDNYGRMTYRYGYEEIDYVDGTSDWVWNAPQHVFFLRLRELFDEELSALYNVLPADCWSATSLISQFNDWQMQFPEELWRLDIERKYIRTYTTSYINGKAYPEFLTERANGRKKTQRAQFEKNQEKYMASKFGSTVAASDDIILRCSVPNTTLVVPMNFDMHLTPYSYMYINVKYNTSPPIKVRAVPNQEYTIKYDGDMADIIEIYSASCLKSVGDLSTCYLTNGTFANATKIRELILGNGTDGYNNTNVMTLGLGSNALLNKLDIQNMSGLTHSLDLSGLKNLEELYAFGSGTSGIIFADGGNIRVAQIPDVGSLQMKNLNYLTDEGFDAASYNKLSRLIAESSKINLIDLINNSASLYQVRLTGINWTLEDTTLLKRLYNLAGVTNSGGNSDKSVLTGQVYVPVIRQKELVDYNAAWPDLEITYNTRIDQFSVTFINDDGSVLDVQYVDKGTAAVDPLTREDNPISIPTKESSVSTDYTFAGWNKELVNAFENQVITATYNEAIRKYTIKYVSMGNQPQETVAEYGSTVLYDGDTPTYTSEESAYKYYLFDRWDQGGYVSGDKTINAIFDSCEYREGYFDGKELSDMRPVEIYMMTKLNDAGIISIQNYIQASDSITVQLGNDFTYSDVVEQVLISEKTEFTGNNYVDTGLKLLSEDRDFVLVIDCKMSSGNANGAVLAQCFSSFDTSGFKLSYDNGIKFAWGSESNNVFDVGKREVIAIRHKKGEYGAHVYVSNVSSIESSYIEFDGNHLMEHELPLVFGCNKAGNNYNNYSVGTVYWSKIWYADLGDDICKKLVSWPHEEIKFDVCCNENESLKYYYIDRDNTSSITFIASNVLSHPVHMNTTSTNSGGWASSTLNTYLNQRVYNAFQDQWRQLIKPVQVKSSKGDNSIEITTSVCHVFVPSIAELGVNTNTSPYSSEGESPIQISHFTNNTSRICYTNDGAAAQYWTRSPSISSSGGNWPYFYVIKANGESNQVGVTGSTSTGTYARIMIAM